MPNIVGSSFSNVTIYFSITVLGVSLNSELLIGPNKEFENIKLCSFYRQGYEVITQVKQLED